MENSINENPIKRALLLMKYDTSKTLTENIDNQSLLNEGLGSETIKNILNKCVGKETKNGVLSDEMIGEIQTLFQTAFAGWILGTDNEKWRKALSMMTNGNANYDDLCKVDKLYKDSTGNSLYDDIDSDIDYENEWSEFVEAFNKISRKQITPSTETPAPAQTPDFTGKFPCIEGRIEVDKLIIKGKTGDEYKMSIDGTIFDNNGNDTGYMGVCQNNNFKYKMKQ